MWMPTAQQRKTSPACRLKKIQIEVRKNKHSIEKAFGWIHSAHVYKLRNDRSNMTYMLQHLHRYLKGMLLSQVRSSTSSSA